ncbi:universal stress protein [Natrarchaeobius sp. A-rgal3]|uniref:universal stress protein n=1 Tax=Natrarchaeobius versutus TaxID=1679078 RepID=UPI00350F9C15
MAILAAIDGKERSERVATVAYDLAATYDDTLIPLHVVPTEDYDAHKESLENTDEFRDFPIDQEAASAKRFAREYVLETIDDVGEVTLEPRGRVGDIPTEILDEVESVDPRYLVISGRRRSPTGKAVFGSTTQKILLNADCPVVTNLDD